MPIGKLIQQHNESILSLQQCNLIRKQKEDVEWMGQIRLKATECGYKIRCRGLKEQSINGISDEEMMTKIILLQSEKLTCHK